MYTAQVEIHQDSDWSMLEITHHIVCVGAETKESSIKSQVATKIFIEDGKLVTSNQNLVATNMSASYSFNRGDNLGCWVGFRLMLKLCSQFIKSCVKYKITAF